MKYLFNGGWTFLETSLETNFTDIQERKSAFKEVEIPHDWLIYDSTDLYRNGIGWYSKDFEYNENSSKRCFITFEGIYMDSEIYINGQSAFVWKYGYSSFTFEITKYLRIGQNNITVSVRHISPNSRWYSGAGIYRSVWLNITNDTYIANDGVYISSKAIDDDYILRIETEVCGEKAKDAQIKAVLNGAEIEEITTALPFDEENSSKKDISISKKEEKVYEVSAPDCDYKEIESGQKRYRYVNEYRVKSPMKWEPENPNLYNIKVELLIRNNRNVNFSDGQSTNSDSCSFSSDYEMVDLYEMRIGFKTITLSCDKGFILNGKNIKLNGVCEHHDLGSLGSAYNSKAMRRKLSMLKEMGVNAIRGTHNMVSPDVLDLLDEMGFVFISEAFDMWRKPKTSYDYARFFDEWHKRDVASWVRRDRNHVCVAFWSIGNEIYDTHADEEGALITKELSDLVKKYDYNGNGYPTIGSNYMPWENAQKCADILKVAGYNYAEKYYEEHHQKHPDWIIYGSETSSIVQSRGIYHFPASASVLSDDDEQCSSLGNSQTSWGAKNVESCIKIDRDTPFSMGQFLWTGFDYIGEPTPYHTKNSYFGQIDTAGFPKDAFYEWQAAWTSYRKTPMVHICPSYWDFSEGQTIDLKIVTNAPKAKLYINGEYIGSRDFSNKPGSGDKISWNLSVPYHKGCVEAKALDDDGNVIATDVIKSFSDAVELRLTPLQISNQKASVNSGSACTVSADNTTNALLANSLDLAFIEISALDIDGNEVMNAQNRVTVNVSGEGRLVGLDNGDSSDLDSYKGISRRLFGGKLLAIIQTTDKEGIINVEVSSTGLKSSHLSYKSIKDYSLGNRYLLKEAADNTYENEHSNNGKTILCYEPLSVIERNTKREIKLGNAEEIPVRKIELINENSCNVLSQENNEVKVSAKVLPENASYKSVTFEVVTEFGVPSNIAELDINGNCATIRAKGDGRFYLRALSNNGSSKKRIISYMDFEVQGMGAAFLNPYDFVAGSLYSGFEGDVSNGNDKGVATARGQKTLVTFDRLDFGRDFGEYITIPVFSLDGGPNKINIWSGEELLLEEIYDKPSIWNVYQEVTWKLRKPLTGICDLSFETYDKLHLKGFVFKRSKRAYAFHLATSADDIYGDTYSLEETMVSGIGNNVSLVYKDMNFEDEKPNKITICGRAHDAKNTIHILFEGEGISTREILEIEPSSDIKEHTFDIGKIEGNGTITFVFLPGSNFDMRSFKFENRLK